jgi:RCC1 and BTB domain-containing protein
VLVLSNGDVCSFGYNGSGQLGLGNTDSQQTPQRIEPLCQKNVYRVECGYYHTVIMTEQGRIHSFGYNANGMLGLNHCDEVAVPQAIPAFSSTQLELGSLCRSHHTIVFKTYVGSSPVQRLEDALTSESPEVIEQEIVQILLSATDPQVRAW